MIKITLKDGSVKELAAPQSIADFTKDLSMGLYRNACCALVDGKVADLGDLLDHDCAVEILTLRMSRASAPSITPLPTSWPRRCSACTRRPSLPSAPPSTMAFTTISMFLPPSPRRTWREIEAEMASHRQAGSEA